MIISPRSVPLYGKTTILKYLQINFKFIHIAEASKLCLDLRYAQNLNFDRSLVTVLINNKPIGSKKLSEVIANQDMLELSIPKNLDVNGNFTVKVAFDLEIEHMPCTVTQDQMPWAYIDSTSMLQLNTVDRSDLLFNYYPANFMRGGGFNAIAIVMPEQLTEADYRHRCEHIPFARPLRADKSRGNSCVPRLGR